MRYGFAEPPYAYKGLARERFAMETVRDREGVLAST